MQAFASCQPRLRSHRPPCPRQRGVVARVAQRQAEAAWNERDWNWGLRESPELFCVDARVPAPCLAEVRPHTRAAVPLPCSTGAVLAGRALSRVRCYTAQTSRRSLLWLQVVREEPEVDGVGSEGPDFVMVSPSGPQLWGFKAASSAAAASSPLPSYAAVEASVAPAPALAVLERPSSCAAQQPEPAGDAATFTQHCRLAETWRSSSQPAVDVCEDASVSAESTQKETEAVLVEQGMSALQVGGEGSGE